ncbi:MAG: alpha/beta family hydrolase [Myxococcota bacterium]
MKTILIGAALLVLVLVVLSFGFVFLFSRPIVFHPTQTPTAEIERAALLHGYRLETIPIHGGPNLMGAVRSSSSAEKLLLFFGGNAFDLPSSISVSDRVSHGLPIDVATFAYRGYDGSTGDPSAWGIRSDALAVAMVLKERYPKLPLILMGQSLGTGVAMQLAADLAEKGQPASGVVLVSPFRSVARLFSEGFPILPVGLAVRDRFDSEAVVDRVKCPVLILHGTADRLIPVEHGRFLAAALSAKLVEIRGAGHGDMWDQDATADAVRSFLTDAGATAPRP